MINNLFESIRNFPVESIVALFVSLFGSFGSIKIIQILYELIFKSRKKMISMFEYKVNSLKDDLFKEINKYDKLLENIDKKIKNFEKSSDTDIKNMLSAYISTMLSQDNDLKLKYTQSVNTLSRKQPEHKAKDVPNEVNSDEVIEIQDTSKETQEKQTKTVKNKGTRRAKRVIK